MSRHQVITCDECGKEVSELGHLEIPYKGNKIGDSIIRITFQIFDDCALEIDLCNNCFINLVKKAR